MDPEAQPANDDLHHFISFLPDPHVDSASFNTGHDPVIYRSCTDLGCQL
jgi:hypothetical protein